ncbi:type IV secretion system DNA-binding domain-containing protein, partial [Patescibacteria group bacterium]
QKEIISVAEQLFASLSGIAQGKGNEKNYLAFEIVALQEEIVFYVAIPSALIEFVTRQVQAIYPDAALEPVEEYNFFLPELGHVAAATLELEKGNNLPIRTYQELESDPLNALTNAISKMNEHEGAAIQFIISPADATWQKSIIAEAEAIQKGDKKKSGISSSLTGGLGTASTEISQTVSETLFGKDQQQAAATPQEPILAPLTQQQQQEVEALGRKVSKVGYKVNIRVIASSDNPTLAQQHLNNILGGFEQFRSPSFNAFKFVQPKNISEVLESYIFRYFDPKESFILNTEELASVYHPPSELIETPQVRYLGARSVPAPADLPTEGRLIGNNTYRGQRRPVYLTQKDRRRHLYLIGKTGTGKTTLFKNMIRDDISEGQGVCVLDPHGDLIEELLMTIPKERAEDVILFDPGDSERPMGLNMLEYENEDLKDFAVGEMIQIFYKLFPPETMGPMFEHNMRNVMLTLMEDTENPGTIAEIPRMFSDEDFQKSKVAKITDPIVKSFWENEMAKTSDFHKSEMLGYLISKVGRFVENRMMRNIIGQPESSFNLRDVMDNGKILLCNLSKGKLGDINSNLLGMILVTKIQMAALARVNTPEDQRRDFYLYLDEFQNFTTDSIATILSEARKYRLVMNMAHQFISQLPEDIRGAVFGNVGTMISYRIGPEDAEIIQKEFEPNVGVNDLVNLDFATAYAKIMANGDPTPAFSVEIPAPVEVSNPEMLNPALAKEIADLSRLKYGRDRAIVESEIAERSQT